MRTLAAPLLLGVALLLRCAHADFIFAEFNSTAGLRLNGHAATTSCSITRPLEFAYSVRFGANDATDDAAVRPALTDTPATFDTYTRTTIVAEADARLTSRFLAAFPHREASGVAPDACAARLRLTPSRPSSTSSVFRLEAVPVLTGFETGFVFQVTDHSRACTQVKDRYFSVQTHQSCSIHGGDGFAFVIHNDGAGSRALGGDLGYAGLRNALAVEFDAWYNPELEVADLIFDHISVQASPPGASGSRGGFVTTGSVTRLGQAKRAPVGDGLTHAVRIVYSPTLRMDLLPHFSGSTALLDVLLDGGEGRRLGTLAVYVDDMAAPVLAVPLNLNVVLALPEDQAFIVSASNTVITTTQLC